MLTAGSPKLFRFTNMKNEFKLYKIAQHTISVIPFDRQRDLETIDLLKYRRIYRVREKKFFVVRTIRWKVTYQKKRKIL